MPGIRKTTIEKVPDDILQNSKYHHSNILICWHHGEILDLAAALGVEANKLPPGVSLAFSTVAGRDLRLVAAGLL